MGGALVKLPLSGTVVHVGEDAVRKMSPQQAYQKGYAEATGHTVPLLDVWGTRLNPKCSAGVSPKQEFSSPSEDAYNRGLALAMAGDSTASPVPALSPVPYDNSPPQVPVSVKPSPVPMPYESSSPPQSAAFQSAGVAQQQAPTQGDDFLGNVYYSQHQAAQIPTSQLLSPASAVDWLRVHPYSSPVEAPQYIGEPHPEDLAENLTQLQVRLDAKKQQLADELAELQPQTQIDLGTLLHHVERPGPHEQIYGLLREEAVAAKALGMAGGSPDPRHGAQYSAFSYVSGN